MRNIAGNFGRMNDLTHALWTDFTLSVEKAMAEKTGLDGSMLYYLAVWQNMEVYIDPYIQKSCEHAHLYLAN